MNLVTSFVGEPPSYWVTCIQQIRRVTESPVWAITNRKDHPVIKTLETIPNVHIIEHKIVQSHVFDRLCAKHHAKFEVCRGLTGREQLFLRSFERSFLCQKLMSLRGLRDVLFLEIDNLIYEDPAVFLDRFRKKSLAYMYDNEDRSSSGIMYVRDSSSLDAFNAEVLKFIERSKEFLTEMTVLARFAKRYPSLVQYLPVHPKGPNVPNEAVGEEDYGDVLFDAAPLGVYLYGRDPYHTKGTIVKGLANPYSKLDFSKYEFSLLNGPKTKVHTITIDSKPYRIFNLHIHSKNLVDAFDSTRPSETN